jgi:iron(III) transport system substrate-binding protein
MTRLLSMVFAGVIAFVSGSALAQSSDFDRNKLIEGAKKEGKLVFYTVSQDQATTEILARFHAKYPFVDVGEFFRSTSGKVAARLKTELEAKNPVADVFSNSNIGTFLELKKASALAQFYTPEMDAYDAKFKDAGYWTIWSVHTIVIGYNRDVLKKEDLPTSWAAFFDPKFKGKIGFEDLTSASQHMQWYMLREVMGKDFWKKVAENRPRVFSGTVPMVEAVLRNDVELAGQAYGYYAVNFAKEGAPFEAIYPKEGVPLSSLPVSVLASAPHPNAARLFVDWLLSPEGQKAMVDTIGDYSVRPGTPKPPVGPDFKDVKVLVPESPEKFLATQQEFTAEWRSIAGAR